MLKAAASAAVRMRQLPTDAGYSLRGDTLRAAIEEELGEERAAALIMTARAPWFEDDADTEETAA